MARVGTGKYPAPPGSNLESVATHAGPSSYTQITTGSPPTGGDTLQAAELGLKFFDSVEVLGASDDGQYSARPVWDAGITSEPTSVKLLWTNANTGAQVAGATNLSARSIRIYATGQ